MNRIPATSSGAVAVSCGPAPCPSRSISARVASANSGRRPVPTRSVADLAQPSSTRANIASGTPMKASGSASSRHCFSARLSMPGSTSTGTAPALNSANISRKNSGVGRTITTVRLPRPMPRFARPAAMASLRRSSSP